MKVLTFAKAAVCGLALGIACAPAGALTMRQQAQQRQGCVQLVNVKHPDLKGKALGEEVKKCRANPDAYN